jgi:hypothetical protein
MEYTFDVTKSTPLCEIMGRNKSDKGAEDITTSWHNYTPVYYSIFKDLRQKPLRLFELGLGTNNTRIPSNMGPNGRPGASLYGWAEFFPNARIFGADIDADILFNTERISTFYCDQTKPPIIKNMWNDTELQENFDIIIDDGLHAFGANAIFFEHSIHKLNPNGFYIVEDISNRHIPLFQQKTKEWKQQYPMCEFVLIGLPSSRNKLDNNLLVIHKSE